MGKKAIIVVGIAIAAVAISMAYGAIANPGGNEEITNSAVWNIRISGPEFQDLPTIGSCLLYTSPSPRDLSTSRMPSSA